jgi:hypothetical protein
MLFPVFGKSSRASVCPIQEAVVRDAYASYAQNHSEGYQFDPVTFREKFTHFLDPADERVAVRDLTLVCVSLSSCPAVLHAVWWCTAQSCTAVRAGHSTGCSVSPSYHE